MNILITIYSYKFNERYNAMSKLLFSILVLIPIIGPIVYLLAAKGTTKREKLIAAIGIIPAVNLICAILLIVSSALS